MNEAAGKGVDGETGNSGKLLLLEWHKEWHNTSQPEKPGPVYDVDSDNEFPPTFCAEKMIANHSDKAKSVPLLGGHLSPKSRLYDQILP